MVRVLVKRAVHSAFESQSAIKFLYFKLTLFSKDRFYFENDLDLEPVNVNSTTSRGMSRVTNVIFHFYQFMDWSIAFWLHFELHR